MKNDTILG